MLESLFLSLDIMICKRTYRKMTCALYLLVLNSFFGFGQINTCETRGIYGHPGPLWEKGYTLSDLGINAVFVHGGSIDSTMVTRAKRDGLKVYAEFATLNGKGYVDRHPEAHAINEKGNKVDDAGWFMGVCPTDRGFRRYRFQQLRKLLTQYDLDGVWMDYVHWHAQFEEPVPILPETCFCEECLDKFSRHASLQIEGNSIEEQAGWILTEADAKWREWRCQVILDWVLEIRKILQELRPGALLGIYHCPWQDEEFDHARRRILGLDYDMLAPVVDVFSPMVYHGRMGREPEWVASNILWHSKRIAPQEKNHPGIWPIVQAHDKPQIISAAEFEVVLKGALGGRASGVMMFTTRAIADHLPKIEIMKKIYAECR